MTTRIYRSNKYSLGFERAVSGVPLGYRDNPWVRFDEVGGLGPDFEIETEDTRISLSFLQLRRLHQFLGQVLARHPILKDGSFQ